MPAALQSEFFKSQSRCHHYPRALTAADDAEYAVELHLGGTPECDDRGSASTS